MYPALPIQQLAGEAGAGSCPRGRNPGSSIEPGITWYDVLGALPGAEARKIKQKYDAKVAPLRPELISGAPPNVLTAVMRAQELLDTAWELLGDPDSRKRYDEAVGFRRSGGGLGQPGTGVESAGLRQLIWASSVSCLAWTWSAACSSRLMRGSNWTVVR